MDRRHASEPARARGLRILVPLDDSIQAQRVLGHVTLLAGATNGTLNLIRATDREDETRFNSLAQHAERLREAGVSVEWSIVSAVDVETAVSAAESAWQPDLIALASTKSSSLDRWLNGSDAEKVIRSAHVPVLVVPPNWERPVTEHPPTRALVPLDGSPSAEQALWVVVRLANLLAMDIVVMHVIQRESAAGGAEAYLRQLAAKAQEAAPDRVVSWRISAGSTASAILEIARDLDVDAIAMATRGHAAGQRVGSTAADVFDHASVPLIFLGPQALGDAVGAQHAIKIGAQVRTSDRQHVGEVHRVVLDLEQQAIVAIVMLSRGGLARDILVPADFIDRVDDDALELRVRGDELEQFPDFAIHEFTTPPPTWTDLAPAREHERRGPGQVAVTRGTAVLATDGELGHVDGVEVELETWRLRAVSVRAGIVPRAMRTPVEMVGNADAHGNVRLTATRAEVAGYLGKESRIAP